ncbi:MAG: alpha/beta fold hydrolase [Verrucomicrobiales bacterium]|nr:alpha/beta fold hydrolase [Verrucomicrobiales bacterium]
MDTVIRNNSGEKIDYSFHDSESEMVVIIGHGVTGNKDRPLVVALGEGLATSGISVLRFSFSGNGDSEGRFVDSTITKELSDLNAVIDAVEAEGKRVIYAGHSMGGAVGVSVAAVDKRIQALISLAGMVNTKKFAETEFGEVIPDEGNMWDDEDCPLSQVFMDDLRGIDTLVEKGSQIDVPWLLVHGTADDVVLIDDTYDIFERAGHGKEKLIIEGSDHVFSDSKHMKAMVDGVLDWIKEMNA